MILAVPMVLIFVAVRLTSLGPALCRSDQVGRYNKIFKMLKFGSMQVGMPAVARHLLADAKSHLMPIESFLRKSSLGELPQLWSISVSDMSFVGLRPALFNQRTLIKLRTRLDVHELVFGWSPPLTLDEGLRIAAGNRANH